MPGTAPRRPARLREPAAPSLPERLGTAALPGHGIADDAVRTALDYGDLDLSALRAEDPVVDGCRFDRTRLAGTVLLRADVSDTEFRGADLAGARFPDGAFSTTAFLRSRLTGAAWTECGLREVLFEGCKADLASFRFSRFVRVVFRDCDLREANFQRADLRGARFEGCRLEAAQFSGASMAGTRFTGCELHGIGGAAALDGAVVGGSDAQSLLRVFAAALGVTVED
ncbi:pentapeptide repeat-containing protein [Nocardiopsis potens]|uniref:pentapeptide repeat-containing protein n=1 Tax=Nocardiopsis potens TaxID=1246458 RepID=UPI000346ECBA|nr:pentapeptide repeat-containing protein [Nocardiopsis potens]